MAMEFNYFVTQLQNYGVVRRLPTITLHIIKIYCLIVRLDEERCRFHYFQPSLSSSIY